MCTKLAIYKSICKGTNYMLIKKVNDLMIFALDWYYFLNFAENKLT